MRALRPISADELTCSTATACRSFTEPVAGRWRDYPVPAKFVADDLEQLPSPVACASPGRVTPDALLHHRPSRHIAVQQSQHQAFSARSPSSSPNSCPCWTPARPSLIGARCPPTIPKPKTRAAQGVRLSGRRRTPCVWNRGSTETFQDGIRPLRPGTARRNSATRRAAGLPLGMDCQIAWFIRTS